MVFVAVEGKQAGPFDLQTLAGHAREGKLTRGTLVWKQGMPAWAPAEAVPELRTLLDSLPPPLPPSPPGG